MARLLNSGRAEIAAAIKSQTLHLAWGAGLVDWDTDRQQLYAFAADDTLSLGYSHVSGVVVQSPDAVTTYDEGIDYTVSPASGVIARLATGAIAAEAQALASFHVDTPPENVEASGLVALLGLRKVSLTQFVTPDPAGDVAVLIDGVQTTFAVSATPTPYLHMRTLYDFADAASETIRELAIVCNSVTDPALPAEQQYFTADQVTALGRILLAQNIGALTRSPAVRESFDFVFVV